MMTEVESSLLRRFRQGGDAEAFAQITRRYAGMVYGTCLRITGNEAAASDAAQDTFFELSRNARKVTDSLGGWLHRVATRRAIDLVRSERSRARREQAYAAEKPLTTDHWADVSPLLDEALSDLDEAQRDVLIRYFLRGETVAEIAATEGVSQPTVSRRVEAALDQLRELLRKRGMGVATAALGVMMAGAAQEAPAVVMAELGKIALATTGTAAASSATATLLGLNAKLALAAAVAVVGVGGYVAYRATRPVETAPPVAAAPLTVVATTPPGTPAATVASARTATPGARSSVATAPTTMVSTDPAPEGVTAVAPSFGTGSVQGGGVPYGGTMVSTGTSSRPPPTRATTEGALTLFANALYAMALGRSDLARLEECFTSTAEVEAFRRLWESPANDTERELQQVLKSLGPVIEVIQTAATEDGLKVKWKATVRQPFTTTENGAAKTWQPGDPYELEARLKQIGGEWKIVGL
jgi:RNA polymerase sigma-70 factor, ECF subfamily